MTWTLTHSIIQMRNSLRGGGITHLFLNQVIR